MTAPIDNSFFADFKGLNALRNEAKAEDPAALKAAAKQFESLFTQMLLKRMREASKSFGESLFGSDQSDFYQDMFDSQIALHLAQGRGLGLADMLVRQLQGVTSGTRAVEDVEAASPSASARSSASAEGSQFADRIDFVRKLMPHARAAARELNVDPHALLAQAALETGWGKSMPRNAAGECSFNLFGIKAGSHWRGAAVNVATLEYEDGVAVRKLERFRAYESPAESFRDYVRLIRGSARYADAVDTGSNITAFASALQQGGYATDPNYARKLLSVAGEVRRLAASEA